MRNVRSHWLWAIPAGIALLAGGYYPSVAQHWALRQSLIDAVKGNDFALTELLLRQGADPNTRDAAGVGLASWAVAQDEQPIAQLLIASGARSDLDYCLRHAAERNEEETALLALKHGADANVRNRLGYTPLMLMSTEMAVSALLARGADVNARAADGTTPLMCAMGDTAATKLLLKAGADPNACDAQGRAPLQVGLATLGSNLQPGPGRRSRSECARRRRLHPARAGGAPARHARNRDLIAGRRRTKRARPAQHDGADGAGRHA